MKRHSICRPIVWGRGGDSTHIDNESTFKQIIRSGINLFTGAGFSTLPDKCGNTLPTGTEYAKEICEQYELDPTYPLDDVANIVPQESLQSYTRERFKVSDINELYYAINKLNLKSYITTNYDNIPQAIFKKNPKVILYDVRGGPQSGTQYLPFIPIHGNVCREDYDIIIGSLKVVHQTTVTSNSMKEASHWIEKYPSLIWGHALRDSSVLELFSRILREKRQRIWIVCRPNDDQSREDYFRMLGCNIISSDTNDLLSWIMENIHDDGGSDIPILNIDGQLKQYIVPSDSSKVRSYESNSYFEYGDTQWYHILTGLPYERAVVSDIIDYAINGTNVIVTGSQFSGKTTILMQVASKIPITNKLFVRDITEDSAKFIINCTKNIPTWIFIDDCFSLNIIRLFNEYKHLTIVATTSVLQYESEKLFLNDVDHHVFDITDINSKIEANKIAERIPPEIRKKDFYYKSDMDERYSLIELITNNVNTPLSKHLIKEIFNKIIKKDLSAAEVLALALYLNNRGSALTTDVAMAYFLTSDYDGVSSKINKVNDLLREMNPDLSVFDEEFVDQDYYTLRSKIFVNRATEYFETLHGPKEFKDLFAEVVRKFTFNVSPTRVWRYDVFKRKQYDSELFYVLFGKYAADELYDYLYYYSGNKFVLQQRALYHRRAGRYNEAFEEITVVKNRYPRNPSVINSYAMILFEMSKEENDSGLTSDNENQMIKAMEILEKLHDTDFRKKYHTEKYAEYAIYLFKKGISEGYVSKALKWIDVLDLPLTKNLEKSKKELMSISKSIRSVE